MTSDRPQHSPLQEDWIADFAHDLRQGMALLIGMVEQLAQNTPGLDPKALRPIQQQALAMSRKLDWLLDLGRGAESGPEFNWVNVDIQPLLDHMFQLFQPLADSKDLVLTRKGRGAACVCQVDAQILETVLSNLLMNAIQHSKGGGTIELGCETLEMDGTSWGMVTVRDEGPGIPLNQLSKIFDRYFVSKHRQSPSGGVWGEGRGLGLAIAKDLTEKMEGRLEVYSEEGKGTEFRVLLKQVEEASSEPEEFMEDTLESSTFRKSEGLPLLLLIDDDEAYVRLLADALKDEYSVVLSTSGRRGLHLARELIPDAIICDVFMKDLDGFRVLRALRQDDLTSHIPTIMLSARVEMKNRIAGLEGGADAYLNKPVNMRELRVRLRKLLELRQLLQNHYNRVAGSAFPGEEETVTLPHRQQEEQAFLQGLRNIVEEKMTDENFSVEDLCKAARLSYIQLYRKLKALTDRSPSQYIRWVRLNKARYLLKYTGKRVSEVANEVGFSDPGYFTRVFREEFGLTPSTLKA
ncbi:MAG: helix-turn-helix domain-containing protein [Bacteroidetes bacterium]|nr:MAG: helix-turn-helix domain-containing protein [Bacteroidota bacterium]